MIHCIVYSGNLWTSGIHDAVKCANVTLPCRNTYPQPEFTLQRSSLILAIDNTTHILTYRLQTLSQLKDLWQYKT